MDEDGRRVKRRRNKKRKQMKSKFINNCCEERLSVSEIQGIT
jgi:hypothetical protein